MYADESIAPEIPAEELQVVQQAWYSLLKEAKAAGVLISNNGFSGVADATSVRVRDGKTLTTDGPFAETHEQLGGFFLVECKDLDEAIAWAAKIPTAKYGTIEVRPLWDQI
jgi:hypothetical protein